MPQPDPQPEQRRRLLLLADEVAGWHAEPGSRRAEEALAGTLQLLAHALVDLADGLPPQPRPDRSAGPGRRGSGREAGVDRASCSALAARLHALGREVTTLVPGPGAEAVAASAAALAETLQQHAQALAGGGRPSPSAVRWLAPRLQAAREPLRRWETGGPPPGDGPPAGLR